MSLSVNILAVHADVLGQEHIFLVNQDYDKFNRVQDSATLLFISSNAYFYVDNSYLNSLDLEHKNILSANIEDLAKDFDNIIYPTETEFWGSEPNPGIDGDPKITIFLEQLVSGNGGYFDTANEFLSGDSNKREMVAVSVDSVALNLKNAKMFLAHEFQHLISFNQKEHLQNITEDVWLNELRSEYSVTLTGYNQPYSGSGLERRVQIFSGQPSDSLTEWPNVSLDYAQASLFGEYLVEQYGPEILKETLHSPYVGIESINQFLKNHNYQERFSDIVGNWAIANYINNISKGSKYGYSLSDLQSLKIIPTSTTNLSIQSPYNFSYSLKPWQPAWYKFNVGQSMENSKTIKLDFVDASFKVFYADNLGRTAVLSDPAYIDNPGGLTDFVIILINQSKVSDFGKNDMADVISLTLDFVDAGPGLGLSALKDGMLIKRPVEKELYVIEGKYKRYLNPGVFGFYGQLDPSKAAEVGDAIFSSYIMANYVRSVDDKKVYAVWPDGTKHWLNMTGDYFTQSGRDWGSIFIINQSELNFYKTGKDITQ